MTQKHKKIIIFIIFFIQFTILKIQLYTGVSLRKKFRWLFNKKPNSDEKKLRWKKFRFRCASKKTDDFFWLRNRGFFNFLVENWEKNQMIKKILWKNSKNSDEKTQMKKSPLRKPLIIFLNYKIMKIKKNKYEKLTNIFKKNEIFNCLGLIFKVSINSINLIIVKKI